ncbi:hypothetical protein F1D05_16415 [Kribbella qitaiheensis]|uniref:2'-5' RNA ligase family protein n=1 Tax=Kribbella qitaiheensis TaxID=1544730 RepID=A0A7G6WYZ2_9ACTN|nr:hypothetical protein [Kribbella qitaiheensis]QNE19207.1 hypothetical protein F1D05_16415 [Kribbella qitaiheensis]
MLQLPGQQRLSLRTRRPSAASYPIECCHQGGTIIKPTQLRPAKFDELHDNAVPLIAAGKHGRDTVPEEGGRWPVSVVLRPAVDGDLSRRLDALTRVAADLAGPRHWHTGRPGSAHLTVRALELYRPTVEPTEPVVQRYQAAMSRAAADCGPARIEVVGLTLTAGTVMAAAVSADDQADLFLDRLAEELGPDGWLEVPFGRRDIWYFNLLHFTGDIRRPGTLIDWVAAHRDHHIGDETIPAAELVRFHHSPGPERPFMRPEVLARISLAGLPGCPGSRPRSFVSTYSETEPESGRV